MRDFFFSRAKKIYKNRTPEEKRRLRRLLLGVFAIYLAGAGVGLLIIFFIR